MDKSVTKLCGRCKNPFECKAVSIEQCDCHKIILSEKTKSFLAKTNYDCLCNSCLSELNKMVVDVSEQSILSASFRIVENKHYYLENRNMVFTELYHIARGYCCKNSCRHCAYGLKNKLKN